MRFRRSPFAEPKVFIPSGAESFGILTIFEFPDVLSPLIDYIEHCFCPPFYYVFRRSYYILDVNLLQVFLRWLSPKTIQLVLRAYKGFSCGRPARSLQLALRAYRAFQLAAFQLAPARIYLAGTPVSVFVLPARDPGRNTFVTIRNTFVTFGSPPIVLFYHKFNN